MTTTRPLSRWRWLVLGLLPLLLLPGCSLLHRHPAEAGANAAEFNPETVGRRANTRGLTVALKVTPDPLKLGEVREVSAVVILKNNGKQTATLKFATGQVLEVQWVDVETGQVLSKYSTDREVVPDSVIKSINAGERAEFPVQLTTRELKPGKTYNLEAFFVGYEKELRATKAIIPQP